MRMSSIACASASFSSTLLVRTMKLFAMTISRHNLLRHSSSQHHHPHHHAAAGAVSYLTAATRSSGSSSSRKNSSTRSYSHSKRTPEPAAAAAAPTAPPTTQQQSSSSSSSSSTLSSNRGRAAVTLLPSYLADARAVERYSPSNPNGALQLGVAESQLLEDWLVPALNDHSSDQKNKTAHKNNCTPTPFTTNPHRAAPNCGPRSPRTPKSSAAWRRDGWIRTVSSSARAATPCSRTCAFAWRTRGMPF